MDDSKRHVGDAIDISDRSSILLASTHGGALVSTGYTERD